MSDFFVAGLVVLALAAVANFGNEPASSLSCKSNGGWSIKVC